MPLAPRARRRASVLVLLLGGVALLATSAPDTWSQRAELQGRPFRLETGAPVDGRALFVVVTPPSSSEQRIQGGLTVDLSARWLPTAGGVPTARPWVRARLVRDGQPLEAQVFVVDGLAPGSTLRLSAPLLFSPPCEKQRRCERGFLLEVERQAEPVDGVLELDWSAGVSVHGSDEELDMPEGLEVRLTER